ncbi:hypothetical protein KZX32_05910 [Corynebacterium kefirresidentii]|uniref:hypothetical protein n=1 Tax=Corynebacterium kefirresidentii TaxID=1979527 RepID=UPI002005F9B3|nr:hypothetical protein [Corynebacterium kefirresidentii]MCK6083026.1 hypothetical protein [Corynebacterium kefirresidentii]
MNNQDQASQVIDKNLPIAEKIERHAHACIIADAIKEAGLLAPDAPQPYFEHGNGPNWEIPINDGPSKVTVRVLYGDVSVSKQGLGFHVNSDEARKIAAAVLAAANYTEEE